MRQEQYGTQTPLYHKLHYNIRGQLYDVRLSTQSLQANEFDWNRGAILNYYSSNEAWGASGADNNGNVVMSQHWVPGDDAISTYSYMTQRYTYDSVNRLQWVAEYQYGTSQSAAQVYAYDQWGNRTINQGATWGTGINNRQFSVDTTTNRLGVPSGQAGTMNYDAAGNLITDTYTGAGHRGYDGENRMTATTDAYYNVTSRYTYDGEGRRVRRNIGGQEVWQVYGLDGEMVAEYAASASATSPQKEYGYRSGELLITATGGSTSSVNLALNKPATQSTTFSDFPASLAVDGNTNGDFNGAHTSSATDYSYQGWWQVDLQSSQTINTIKVWPRTDCCTEHLANYYVLVSDQPFQSTDLQTTLNQAGVSSYFVYGYTYSPTTVNIGRTGRYVRVQRSDSQYLVLAEVEVLGQQQGAGNADVEWIVTDQLGTPRMIADQTGSLAGIKRHDYLPFGEELFAGTGGRTTGQGYSQFDGVRQRYTGAERDDETGLDFMQARYYANVQGRFTSPDPYNIILEAQATAELNPEKAQAQFVSYLSYPQQWNRYSYVSNNPLKYVDPTGELLELTGDEEDRKRGFKRIQELVGKGAAGLLYVREQNGHYYVDYRGKPGDGDRLAARGGELGVFIANIIDSNKTVEFRVATEFNTKDGRFSVAGFGGAATVGAEESLTGNTQIFVHPDAGNITTEKFGATLLGRSSSSNGRQLDYYNDIVDAHEFGHAYANAIEGIPLKGSNTSNPRSLQLENYVRERRGLNRRIKH